MSADEMPCGCWGHADYEERCRYPKLEQDLSAERKRREGLEDELHLERLAHTAAVTRADQAERERDAEREAVGLSAEDRDSAIQRAEQAERERDAAREGMSGQQRLYAEVEEKLERAEADNAALLDGLRTAHDPHAFNTCHGTDCACGVVALLDAHHPGAAMLERMRALEDALRDAVEWMRRDGGANERGEPCRHAGSCKWQRAETVLLMAANALKETP